jgi:hypothetical protein
MSDAPPTVPEGFEIIDAERGAAVGPPAVLLAGFAEAEVAAVRSLLVAIGAPEHRVLRCTASALEQTVEQALGVDPGEDPLPAEKLPRVLLLSGLPDPRVHAALDHWAGIGLPRPLFACATPSNLAFTVKRLLGDLWREHRALSATPPRPPRP